MATNINTVHSSGSVDQGKKQDALPPISKTSATKEKVLGAASGANTDHQNKSAATLLKRVTPHWQNGWSPKDKTWKNGLYNISKIVIEVFRSILFLICFVPLKLAIYISNLENKKGNIQDQPSKAKDDKEPTQIEGNGASSEVVAPKNDPEECSSSKLGQQEGEIIEIDHKNDSKLPKKDEVSTSKDSKISIYKTVGVAAAAVGVIVAGFALNWFFSVPTSIEESVSALDTIGSIATNLTDVVSESIPSIDALSSVMNDVSEVASTVLPDVQEPLLEISKEVAKNLIDAGADFVNATI